MDHREQYIAKKYEELQYPQKEEKETKGLNESKILRFSNRLKDSLISAKCKENRKVEISLQSMKYNYKLLSFT